MKIIDVEQGTEEWLAARAGKLTASKISDVMARGRNGSPSKTREKYLGEIVSERLTGQPSRMSFKSQSMAWGNETEDQARAVYTMTTGNIVQQVGMVIHPECDLFAASPDGLIGDDGGLEIKCPDTHTHIKNLEERRVPPEYVKQIQWNLACTDRAWWDFMSFDPSMPDHMQAMIVRMERNEDMIEEMLAAAHAFNADVEAKIARLVSIYGEEMAA
jgi:putative phage-type endonuclease